MKRFFSIGWLFAALVVWTSEAQACSCERLSRQEVRDKLPVSFDGRVVKTEVLSLDGGFAGQGEVRASVTVIRKIKGDMADGIEVLAPYDNRVGCGVGSLFERLQASGHVVEFGTQPFGGAPHFVSMCTLIDSELDPTKGKGLGLWRTEWQPPRRSKAAE